MSVDGSYFMVIPASVWNDKTLSPAAERLYGRISILTKKFGYCFASNTYLAEMLQSSPRTVQRWLLELKNAGHIRIELEGPLLNERKIWLTIAVPSTTNLSPPTTNLSPPPHDKNVVENKKEYCYKSRGSTEFLDSLRVDPYFKGIDVDAEYERAVRWCKKNERALTQRFFRDWLGRADRPDLDDDRPEEAEAEADGWTAERTRAALQIYPGVKQPLPLWPTIPLDVRAEIDAQVKKSADEKKPGRGNAGTNGVGLNGSQPKAKEVAGGSSQGGTEAAVVEGKTVLKEDSSP